MSESQAASAMERMYEDTSVRDEIVDQDARILLQWGEAQINKLASKEMDDGLFENAYARLTRVMGRINRFVGKRHDADETQQAELLDKFAAAAAEAGYQLAPEKLAAFIKEHNTMDDAAAIRALTAMLPDETPTKEAPQITATESAAVPAEIDPSELPTVEMPAVPSPANELATAEIPTAPSDEEQPEEKPASTMDAIMNWIKSQSSEGKE